MLPRVRDTRVTFRMVCDLRVMPGRRKRNGVLKLSHVPEMKTAIFIALDVPVAIEVDGDREGGVTLTHDVLDGAA